MKSVFLFEDYAFVTCGLSEEVQRQNIGPFIVDSWRKIVLYGPFSGPQFMFRLSLVGIFLLFEFTEQIAFNHFIWMWSFYKTSNFIFSAHEMTGFFIEVFSHFFKCFEKIGLQALLKSLVNVLFQGYLSQLPNIYLP